MIATILCAAIHRRLMTIPFVCVSVAIVSDCHQPEKNRKLPSRKPTGRSKPAGAEGFHLGRISMKSDIFAPRSLWLAGAFLGALTVNAAAQQPAASPAPSAAPAAAAPLPPGSPLIGRPADNEAAAKLAPIAPPPIPAAADKLPTAKLKVPAGFNIEVFASGIANARSLAEGDKGTIFVGSRLVGNVYAITDKDGKRTVKTIASGLHRPNGVAFKNGTLYIAERSKVSKVEKAEDNLDSPAKLTTIYDNLPKDEAHGWKFIAIGPDNKLYVPIGQP